MYCGFQYRVPSQSLALKTDKNGNMSGVQVNKLFHKNLMLLSFHISVCQEEVWSTRSAYTNTDLDFGSAGDTQKELNFIWY